MNKRERLWVMLHPAGLAAGFVVVFIIGMALAEVLSANSARYPRFECRPYHKPLIRCEAFDLFPALPVWEVFYPYGSAVATEYDTLRVAWLTVPASDEWSLLRMSFTGGKAEVRVRWKGLTLEYALLRTGAPCGNDKICS